VTSEARRQAQARVRRAEPPLGRTAIYGANCYSAAATIITKMSATMISSMAILERSPRIKKSPAMVVFSLNAVGSIH
jgi:hypothetical protein